MSTPHFRVEKLFSPIVVQRSPKVVLRWAVICTVTGGRHTAKQGKKAAEEVAEREGEAQCWLCTERQRGMHVREVGAPSPEEDKPHA